MTKEEQILQEALITTYKKNLELFSIVDQSLYQRIFFLSNAINSGEYKERYFLEFIKESGDFDIYDEHEQKFLYDKKPKEWNKRATLNTNLDTLGTFNLFNPALYQKNIVDLSEEDFSLFSLSNIKTAVDIQPFKKVLNETDFNRVKKVKSFDKFIFIGTLLGRHFLSIIKKINCKTIFVCESNLEIFRLSLFVFDYTLLFSENRRAYFSIMDNENDFIEKFMLFFNYKVSKNILLKYHTTDYNVSNYFDLILNAIYKFDPYKFNYRAVLDSIIKKTSKNSEKYELLNFSKNIGNPFEDNPILLLGAGPSMGKNIEWIKENQNKFIIVALAVTLNKLTVNNIIPDIIISYDPQEIVKNHFLRVSDRSLINEKIKLISASSDDSVLNLFENDKNLFTFETYRSLFDNSTAITGVSVGEASLLILLLFNVKKIYMLGLDLALDQKTGRSHIDTHYSYIENSIEKISKNKSSIEKGSYSLRDDYIKVKGNFFDKVYTTRLFYTSLIEMNQIIKYFRKEETTIYNLSENGAYIEKTIPLEIKDERVKAFPQINKEHILQKIKKSFTELCNEKLKGKKNLHGEIDLIDEILNRLKKFESTNISRAEEFETEVDLLIDYIRDNSLLFLFELLTNYLLIINRYISYCFNLKELKHEKSKIKKVKYFWIKQFEMILKEYRSYLINIK